MKKIFAIGILLSLSLVLTGCQGNKNMKINENNAPDGLNNFDSSDVVGRINDLKNGLTPKVKPSRTSPAPDDTAAPDADPSEAQKPQLENLAAEYSSALVSTNFGQFKLKFYPEESPVTVNVFMNLAQLGFYEGTKFHRVIKDFMIQGGDPLSKDNDPSNDGSGGPGFKFQDEINAHKLVLGSLAMANSGPNTNGSQFFIVTADSTAWLDGKHTNFGYVSEGLEVVKKIGNLNTDGTDHPLEEVIIEKIELKP